MNQTPNGQTPVIVEQPHEILTDAESYKAKLRNDPAVQNLTSEVDINDINSIVTFGSRPGNELAAMADEILRGLTVPTDKDAMEMLNKLTKVMSKFDIKELQQAETNPGLLKKIANKIRNELDHIIAKYDNMANDIDKIFVLIKQYEKETLEDNRRLSRMYQQNLATFQEYEKYVVAADIAHGELIAARDAVAANMELSEYERNATVSQLNQLVRAMEQRAMEMVAGGVVAYTTTEMLLNMQQANANLLTQYQAAFSVGIPILKSQMAQAIMLKKQAIRAEGMTQFSNALQQQIINAADQSSRQGLAIAQQTSQGLFTYETLEKSYNTVVNGTAQIQQALVTADRKREEDRRKLEQLTAANRR